MIIIIYIYYIIVGVIVPSLLYIWNVNRKQGDKENNKSTNNEEERERLLSHSNSRDGGGPMLSNKLKLDSENL